MHVNGGGKPWKVVSAALAVCASLVGSGCSDDEGRDPFSPGISTLGADAGSTGSGADEVGTETAEGTGESSSDASTGTSEDDSDSSSTESSSDSDSESSEGTDSTSTGVDGGEPMTTDGGGNGGPSCADHAAGQNWGTFYCDNGNGVCEGEGVVSDDCDLCCSGPSCGTYAGLQGWDEAYCEWNDNGACGGQGTPTWDCEFCCGVVFGGTTTGTTTGGGGGDGLFSYPVGDQTSYPAGGWLVWQVMGHYWGAWGGRHLAQDIAAPGGGLASIDAPVYSVADGVVRYAGTNGSSYKHVVLIEHDDGEGGKVCSFYGHVNAPLVSTGQQVSRGQQITSVRDWAQCINGGSSSNTHLHYVLLSKPLCDLSASNGGGSICGYDNGGENDIDTIAEEPYFYTAIADDCGVWQYPDGFISPTKFIEDHKF